MLKKQTIRLSRDAYLRIFAARMRLREHNRALSHPWLRFTKNTGKHPAQEATQK